MRIDTKPYTDFTQANQAEFNRIHDEYGFSAFSPKQIVEGLEKLESRGYSDSEITYLGYGFYMVQDHVQEYEKFNKACRVRLREMMSDYNFALGAFYYEMCNHEYGINLQGAWDVCSVFGNVKFSEGATGLDYLKQLGYGGETARAFKRARLAYYADAEENEWF